MNDKPIYYLDFDSEGSIATAGLNGAPILQDRQAKGLRTSRPVNEWVRPGKNRLHMFLTWPRGIAFKPGVARAKASVYIADPKEPAPTPLVTFASATLPLPAVPEVYPARIEIPFELEHVPPTRLWQEAVEIKELSDSDRGMMITTINRFADALVGGHAQEALGFVEYRYAEEERANYKDAGTLRAVVLDQYHDLAEAPEKTYEPLTVDKTSFRIVADGSLVIVERTIPEHAIVITAKERRFRINVYFAKINDRWVIAR